MSARRKTGFIRLVNEGFFRIYAAVLFLSLLSVSHVWGQAGNLQSLEPIEPPSPPSYSTVESPLGQMPLIGSGETAPSLPEVGISLRPAEVTVSHDGTASFEVRFDFPAGFHQSRQEEFFGVTAPESSPFRIKRISYPDTGVMEDGILNYYDTAVLTVETVLTAEVNAGEYRVPFQAAYQLCDEGGTCYTPRTETFEAVFRVPEDVTPFATAEMTGVDGGAGEAEGESTGEPAAAQKISGSGPQTGTLLKILLFAFIGGLLLNIMPCVLPVLSIRALNLVKQSGNKRREIFNGSLFYTAGILASLLVLAGAVIALKLSGELVGWGFQFQNPLFVVFLITVVFVFALSLFDVFVFQAPVMNSALQRAGQKGYIGSFFNGIIAVLLATPCTAPLLGTALGFAFSQTPAAIIGIFSMIGLGFALPFLLIGVRPSIIQRLPKPGAWMNTFKELMGFVLLGTVLYLMSVLRYQINSAAMIRVLIFLLLIGFFLWVYGKTAGSGGGKRRWIILIIFCILSISAAGRLLQFEERSETLKSYEERGGWESFSPSRLAEYRQEGRAVLVVFSAEWCTVCKLNERTVLRTEEAERLFESFGVQVLHGDYTNEDETIGEWIYRYGRAGVPVYAYYPPGASSFRLLPEVLSLQVLESFLQAPSS